MCQDCADKRRLKLVKKVLAGECIKISCKNKAVPGESRCLHCKQKRNAYNRRRRLQHRAGGTQGKPLAG
jgi:hypothetical protein